MIEEKKPLLIQIDDVVREMTPDEIAIYLEIQNQNKMIDDE